MKRMFFVVIFLLVSVPAMAMNYEADFVQQAGTDKIQGKIYVKGKKMRMDMEMDGHKTTFITAEDKVYMLNHDQKMAMAMPYGGGMMGGMMGPMPQAIPEISELETQGGMIKKGIEEVGGLSCEKFLIQDGTNQVAIWISKKLGIPVKMRSQGESGTVLMEYKNIKIGKVQDSVFEVPAGFQMMQMPGGY